MTTLLMATADRPRAGSFAPSFPDIQSERERYAWIIAEYRRRVTAQPGSYKGKISRDVATLAFGITIEELQSASRKAELVDARKQIACIIRVLTNTGWLPIGRLIGRNHATVIYYFETCGAEVAAKLSEVA